MKTGKLIVQPMGGLANRIRVLAYCFQLSMYSHADMVCRWAVNNELYAPFDSLFQSVPFKITNVYGKQWLQTYQRKWYKRLISKIKRCIHGIDVWLPYDYVEDALKDGTEKERGALTERIKVALLQGQTVYIATGAWLGTVTNISYLQPVESIRKRIKENTSVFEKGHCYGLLIRRTDNTWSIEHSPIELFEHKIEEIISKDKKVKFYLATDDAETAQHLYSKYGDCIVYREKELSRTSESGIREAVIDMWLLGNMDEIYGSYWSSFSEVASWIHHKPLYCISDADTAK
ncbi:MAG: hypothetical protein IKP02_07865 [Paludibacteraceae bacterium]|nr:hypothetical protein [Paludibacteraceae bacterium]